MNNNIRTYIYTNKADVRAFVTRNGVTRSRRFLNRKFGGQIAATAAAAKHVQYLSECTDYQFANATRPVGRPFKTEYFAANDLRKA